MFFCTTFLYAQPRQEVQARRSQTAIPVSVQISERIENIDGIWYHLHTIERGQTLYSISRAYDVPINQIRRTVDKPEIQVDEILLIPANAERIPHRRNNFSDETKSTNNVLQVQNKNINISQRVFDNPPKTTLNVALMLPLYLNEVEQIRITPRMNQNSIRPFSFISFYEGASLVAQAFEDKNTTINVHVFDVTEDVNSATRLINNGRLNDMDIIVGPLFGRSFAVMSEYAKQQEIFIVNPLSPRDDILDNNPFVIKINTSERNQLQNLLSYVAQKSIGQRILIVSNDSLANEKERSEQTRLFFENRRKDFDTIIFIDISRENFSRFNNNLSDTKGNAIIYLSSNEAFVTQILSQTSKREQTTDVLYSLLKLSRFEVTEPMYLNDMQTHYVDPFFVDYTNEYVRDFERLFFENFGTIPDNNAYIGYNVMNFVFKILSIGNTNYGNYLETTTHESFQNKIRLQRTDPLRGLENQETNIFKIENSQLRKVNN
jgi:LysM repeat protein/ABC-type branched-subunit amino acid transport system substrate-binding protein